MEVRVGNVRSKTPWAMLLWENNAQYKAEVLLPPQVNYFSITTHPKVFYLIYTTAIYQP